MDNARASAIKAKRNGNKTGPEMRFNRNTIFDLRQQGLSMREIARKVGCSASLVCQISKTKESEG